MKYLNLLETDHTLSSIIDEITANQSEITIIRNGSPVARIVPAETTSSSHHYPLRGKPITIANDFDEPMPELWEALAE